MKNFILLLFITAILRAQNIDVGANVGAFNVGAMQGSGTEAACDTATIQKDTLTGKVATAINVTITTTNMDSVHNITALPSWMSFDSATGTITGTPDTILIDTLLFVAFGCANDTDTVFTAFEWDSVSIDSCRGRISGDSIVQVGDTCDCRGGYPIDRIGGTLDSAMIDDSNVVIIEQSDTNVAFIIPTGLDTGCKTIKIADLYYTDSVVCGIYLTVPDSSTLTLTQTAGGTVSSDPAAAKRQSGDQSTISAVADLHYTFSAWTGDLSDSTGSPLTYNYPASGSYTASAYFRLDTVIVFYDPNGASGEPPTAKLIGWGQTFTVPGPGALTFAGYGFTGWNTAADGSGTDYAEGSTYTGGSANQTLYAQWTATPRMLTIDTTGNGATDRAEGIPFIVPDGDSALVIYMADIHNHYVSTTVTGGATARDTASGAQWIIVSGGDGAATFNFGPDTFGLAYTITGGNAIVTYLGGDSLAPYNTNKTCTLTVSTGYTADWPGGHVGAGKWPLTVLMTKDSTLAVTTHARPVYTVDTTWGAYLSAWTVSGGLSHDSGTTISMSATCEACSSFAGYTGDYTGSNRSASFVITGNMAIGAGCEYGTCASGNKRSLFGFLRAFQFGWM